MQWKRQWHPTPVLLPGKSHGGRSLVGCSPWSGSESDMTDRLHFQFSLSCIGEGNGNPLQCSCLENPRVEGVWWAAVYGVAQSWTQMKRLSSSSSMLYLGFSGSSAGEESACSAGDSTSISGTGRSPGEGIGYPYQYSWTSLVAQTSQVAKNPPAVREMWVQSLGWENHWSRAWQPTPVFLPAESPWTEEPGGLQSMGSQSLTWLSN